MPQRPPLLQDVPAWAGTGFALTNAGDGGTGRRLL